MNHGLFAIRVSPTQGRGELSEPICSIDLFPTLAGLQRVCRYSMPLTASTSVRCVKEKHSTENLFIGTTHTTAIRVAFPEAAIREGDYKLVERYEDGRVHLYNLKEDIGEQNDLSDAMPERVDQLARSPACLVSNS